MTSKISPIIKAQAHHILVEIKKAKSILLHCHPSPDPDSVSSALAMKFALENLGKKATVIKGDSDIPQAFMHFPGAKDIVQKNFFELDLKEFDLFIILDSSKLDRVSQLKPIVIPEHMTTVNIDHHATNDSFGDVNLVESKYPATSQILFDLFTLWGVDPSPEIAANLFMGIYTDTGGLKYRGVTVRTFEIGAQLVKTYPAFPELISDMENSNTPATLAFEGLALNSIETFLDGKLVIASVTFAAMKEKGIEHADIGTSMISPLLRTVIGWDVDVALVEAEPGIIKVGLRTRDMDKYDVSKLAVALGGGGHKAAAGAILKVKDMNEAKKIVVAKVKELYNL